MPKIKEIEISEEQVEILFQQLNHKLKAKLFKEWLDQMDKQEAEDWMRISETSFADAWDLDEDSVYDKM
jgi:predicted Zn-dependent peptidase